MSENRIDLYRHPWEISFNDFIGKTSTSESLNTGIAREDLAKKFELLSERERGFAAEQTTGLMGIKAFVYKNNVNKVGQVTEFRYKNLPTYRFCVMDDGFRHEGENIVFLYHKKNPMPVAVMANNYLKSSVRHDFEDIQALMVLSLARYTGTGSPRINGETIAFDHNLKAIYHLAHRDACLIAYSCGLQVPEYNVEAYRLRQTTMKINDPAMVVLAAARHAQSIMSYRGVRGTTADMMRLPTGDVLTERSGAQFMKTLIPMGKIVEVNGHEFFIHENIAVDLSKAAYGNDITILNLNLKNHKKIFEKKIGSISDIKGVDFTHFNDDSTYSMT